AGIYGIGLKTKGTDLLADRIRLLHLQSRDSQALVASGTGVFAPHTGTHTVGTTSGSLVAPLLAGWAVPFGNVSVNGGGSGQGPDPPAIEGDPAAVRMSWANPDSMQAFGEQYTEKEPGSLEEHLTVAGGRVTGTVTNRLPVTLTDAAVIYGTNFATFGPIRPGGSVTVDIALPTGGPQWAPTGGPTGGPGSGGPASTLPDQIYLHTPAQCSGPACGSGLFGSMPRTSRPTARQREAQRRSQVLSGVLGPNVVYVPQPLFVAWAETTAGSVRIDGHRARLNQLDGFFLPLQSETGAVLPAGIVRARPIDTNGTAFGLGVTYGAPTFLPPNNQASYE